MCGIHFCIKIPCELQDKEIAEILDNGFSSSYFENEENLAVDPYE